MIPSGRRWLRGKWSDRPVDLPAAGLMICGLMAPKCALCYAVLCGAAGTLSLAEFSWEHWVIWAVLVLLLGVALVRVGAAARRGRYVPFLLAITGATALVVGKVGVERGGWLVLAGLGLLMFSMSVGPGCLPGLKARG